MRRLSAAVLESPRSLRAGCSVPVRPLQQGWAWVDCSETLFLEAVPAGRLPDSDEYLGENAFVHDLKDWLLGRWGGVIPRTVVVGVWAGDAQPVSAPESGSILYVWASESPLLPRPPQNVRWRPLLLALSARPWEGVAPDPGSALLGGQRQVSTIQRRPSGSTGLPNTSSLWGVEMHNGILLCHKKECSLFFCESMDGPGESAGNRPAWFQKL
ncbi:uncharacterized protein LOC128626743 [Artibeus jamaicensis]|uniref:uncharacterized protein LOC128626743 n=1 Tax=Artibeus jamaicensis TaxID=9417 RepID=UPI00235AFB5D|nr:uncharacterized protein LOC128626743 [Artibeus jamaicensis]